MSNRDPHDVVRAFSGPIEIVEAHKVTLLEAGIHCTVVGTDLSAGFGTVMPSSIELWVNREDLAKVEDLIHGRTQPPREPAHFPHPSDSPKSAQLHHKKPTHINPDPRA
jgi:hypothetical protein